MARKKLSGTGADSEALYVRAPPDLVRELDAWLEDERAARPGYSLSRADLIRDILFRAVQDRKKPGRRR